MVDEVTRRNSVPIDVENRCQGPKCNPRGDSRLLFKSAGKPTQPIEVRCWGCGHMNTFWPQRISIDEHGSVYMKQFRSEI